MYADVFKSSINAVTAVSLFKLVGGYSESDQVQLSVSLIIYDESEEERIIEFSLVGKF